MDVLSHALWGYAATRWRGPKTGRWGALLGAAPDLLYGGAALIRRVSQQGLAGLGRGPANDRRIWRADGPPMPQELINDYNDFYRYTHSLVVLLGIALLWYAWRRRAPWPLLAWMLHVVMDIPSHERYLTPFLFPISDFTVMGISWSSSVIFIPNLALLALTYCWLYWRYWRPGRPPRSQPWPEQRDATA